jgi:beta-galactosidase
LKKIFRLDLKHANKLRRIFHYRRILNTYFHFKTEPDPFIMMVLTTYFKELMHSFRRGILFFFILIASHVSSDAQRITRLFDKDWHFFKGDSKTAEQINFNDGSWRRLDLPHDWSIEGPYDENNPTGRGGGYLPAGIGWYRKNFRLENSYSNKKILIEFDGIMANSDIWINGVHLGHRPYGYVSFCYDLTGHLNFGKNANNIIAVRVDNSIQPASRFYTGAGIYRHVYLIATAPVHIDHWGVFITTPKVSTQKATVNVQTKVDNESKADGRYMIKAILLDPAGKKIQESASDQNIPAGKNVQIDLSLEIQNPHLWNVSQFNKLYKAVVSVSFNKTLLDDDTIPFGIRTERFDAATGFWLNNKNLKIKGVCLHHDGGAVGAAVPLGIWRRRLQLLKKVGVNAIRTSHNPVAPEFLGLCDQMGFLVMDEAFDTWTAAKKHGEKGYNHYFKDWWRKDLSDMVMRDRNHPAIVIYSVGNEIHDNLNDAEGFKKYKDLQDLVHSLDSTRPVTMALFRPASSHVYTNGFAQMMDIVGQNYRENELVAAHETHPDWKVIGTENGHSLSAWLALRDNPFMAGQFLWTGFDYLGEADWPATTNSQGLFDRTARWKPLGFQRQSWWSDKPVVHIVRNSGDTSGEKWVAEWTPADLVSYQNATVQVYSNCNEVQLFLNGKSFGSKPKPSDDSPREWNIPFQKGTVKAIGKNDGKEVATDELKTANTPEKIALTIDESSLTNNWNDVAIVTATIVDSHGIPCPNANDLIKFKIEGSGEIAAVDNGDIFSHKSYQGTEDPAYKGRCIAIIKTKDSSGKIKISATAKGLKPGAVSIEVKKQE